MTGEVVVVGEVLAELSTTEGLHDGTALRLGFSGDALNAAAAAAAAGAHAVLVARVPDDELGEALVDRVSALGVDTASLKRTDGQHGAYIVHADPAGERQFIYLRRGSAGSELEPTDLDESLLRRSVVLASGIGCAISTSAAATIHRAAELAAQFVFDPNFRPRLTTPDAASANLRGLAPLARLITPSWPGEISALLGAGPEIDQASALVAAQQLGARAVAMTCGPAGVLLAEDGVQHHVASPPAPRIVDQTGAGDVFVGTVSARLALGDDLVTAVELAVAAASLSVQGVGGTGFIPSLAQTRHHRAGAAATS